MPRPRGTDCAFMAGQVQAVPAPSAAEPQERGLPVPLPRPLERVPVATVARSSGCSYTRDRDSLALCQLHGWSCWCAVRVGPWGWAPAGSCPAHSAPGGDERCVSASAVTRGPTGGRCG